MATSFRRHHNLLPNTLGASLASAATAITLATALQEAGSNIATLGTDEYLPLVIQGAEIVYLSAYTAGATTGTVVRAQEGTADPGTTYANGTAIQDGPTKLDIPGAQLGYTERTTQLTPTATTEATAEVLVTAPAIAFDGVKRVEVQFHTPFARPDAAAGAVINFYLYDGSSSIGRIATIGNNSGGGSDYDPVTIFRYLTPSNAIHTYSIRCAVSSGTGLVVGGAGGSGDTMPAFIRVKTA